MKNGDKFYVKDYGEESKYNTERGTRALEATLNSVMESRREGAKLAVNSPLHTASTFDGPGAEE